MRHAFAAIWLALVIAAIVCLALMARTGFPVQTDLLALLPREERDPLVQRANEAVSHSIGRRIFLAFGDSDREKAREAARLGMAAIERTGHVDLLDNADLQDIGQKMATFYLPYSAAGAVLSVADRKALESDRATDIANRATAQAFGFGSPVDARLLSKDPFLLLPSFLSSLPTPLGRLTLDNGLLTVVDGTTTWVFVPMTLKDEVFDLRAQQALIVAIDNAIEQITKINPSTRVLRLGAVFFANRGARSAIDEASRLTFISILGTILLIVCVFRRLSPLLLNLMAVATGIVMAFAATFLLFGGIHVAALLFGTSLIGVVVDYGLLYSTLAFASTPSMGPERLAYVMPSITLGLVTTLMGYAALAFAPFPGLKQIAIFAVIGLISSFTTVVLWFPLLDRMKPLTHGRHLLRFAILPWTFWTAERYRMGRPVLVAACFGILVTGFASYRTDDDVRRLQALSPALVAEQLEIQRLIGAAVEAQYLLVAAPSDEAALQQEEAITPLLDELVAERAIAGYQMPSTFVPSMKRQSLDRALVETKLIRPLLAGHRARLGLVTESAAIGSTAPLTLDAVVAARAVPLLPDLIVGPGIHIVVLQGLAQTSRVQAAFAGQSGVRFINPTSDFSRLLGAYRDRAIDLTVISLCLVACLLAWRYGLRGAFWTVLPPTVAALLVPAVVSLTGQPFTFFHAMGLVLVLGIGADYTIFCAETRKGRQSVTMLSILLAASMTLLSFGLLALSDTLAVRSFGMTMLVGVISAYLLAPIASRAQPRHMSSPQ